MTFTHVLRLVCSLGYSVLLAQSAENAFGAGPTRQRTSFLVEAGEDVSSRFPGVPRLQSFAWAQWEGLWIFIAGRTSGYHGIGGADVDFPRARANGKIWVIDPSNDPARTYSFPVESLPATLGAVKDQWLSTNILYFQDGETLYLAGGYGQDSSGQWVTHAILSSVHLPSLVKGVRHARDTFSATIAYVNSPHVQSAGGELLRLNDGMFYLVGGHVFTGKYSDFQTSQEKNTVKASQQYLGEIRKLLVKRDHQGRLSVFLIERYRDPEFARRDLNVAFTIAPDGVSLGAAAYGGVFTKEQLNFSKPVYWSSSSAPKVDHGFEQKMSAYSCAKLLMFERATGTMYTTFFGGISRWTWDYARQQPNLAPRVGDKTTPVYLDGMAWVDQISTLVRAPGETYEVVHASRLPSYVGTNAVFIPVAGLERVQPIADVFDMRALRGKRVLVGYIYGGIRGFPREFPYRDDSPLYSSGNVPTKASDLILAVYVTAPPAP